MERESRKVRIKNIDAQQKREQGQGLEYAGCFEDVGISKSENPLTFPLSLIYSSVPLLTLQNILLVIISSVDSSPLTLDLYILLTQIFYLYVLYGISNLICPQNKF